jgi:hypothetical protein
MSNFLGNNDLSLTASKLLRWLLESETSRKSDASAHPGNQLWPINVRGGQKFMYVSNTGQINGGMLAWKRVADYFLLMIKTSSTRVTAKVRKVGA